MRSKLLILLAGAEGLEPTTCGFGDLRPNPNHPINNCNKTKLFFANNFDKTIIAQICSGVTNGFPNGILPAHPSTNNRRSEL